MDQNKRALIQSKASEVFGKGQNFNNEKSQQFIRNQKRMQGQLIAVTTSAQSVNVTLGGNQSFLFGINIMGADAGDLFSLNINNEDIIKTTDATSFDPSFRNFAGEYFEYPRPLNGSDQITVNYTGVSGSRNVFVNFYFI